MMMSNAWDDFFLLPDHDPNLCVKSHDCHDKSCSESETADLENKETTDSLSESNGINIVEVEDGSQPIHEAGLKAQNQEDLIRKALKKGRVFEIRRLTRRITLFRKKKGTDKELEKNKRKVDRLLEEIEIMKNFNFDELTKKTVALLEGPENLCYTQALESQLAWQKLLLDSPLGSQQETAYLRLIGNKSVRHNLWKIKNGKYILSSPVKKKDEGSKEKAKKKKKKGKGKPKLGGDTTKNMKVHTDKSRELIQKDDEMKQENIKEDEHLSKDNQPVDDSNQNTRTLNSIFIGSLSNTKGKKSNIKAKTSRKNTKSKQKLSNEKKLAKFKQYLDKLRKTGRNRLGQRARRELWEKFYGETARHFNHKRSTRLNKSNSVKTSKSTSYKRHANNSKSRLKTHVPDKRSQNMKNSGYFQHDKSTKLGKKELHPSWEARKAQKQKQQVVEFKGTKITFDD